MPRTDDLSPSARRPATPEPEPSPDPAAPPRDALGDRVRVVVPGEVMAQVVRAGGRPRYLIEVADATGRRIELEFGEADVAPAEG